MSYSPSYIPHHIYRGVEKLWKDELKNQWKQRARWNEIYDTVSKKLPLNSSILDLGAGDEPIKAYKKHNREYLSIDLNDKCIIKQDLDYEKLDLWRWRTVLDTNLNKHVPLPEGADRKPWDFGLCIEVIEYLRDPVETLKYYKQFANKWIITTRVGRPEHIYIDNHPLKIRFRYHQEVKALLKNVWNNVEVTDIPTNLTTCSGKKKPFALAICED